MNADIETLVKTTLQTQIVKAFHEAPEAIDKLVEAAMSQQVDEHGFKPDRYSARGTMPYLEWLVGDTIRSVARSAVIDIVAQREAEIREAIEQALTADHLVEAHLKSILAVLEKERRLTIQFPEVKSGDRDDW